MRRYSLLLILFCAAPLHAQIFNIGVGSSTLIGATGAQVTSYFHDSESRVSVGEFSGHFLVGASENFSWRGWEIGAGDNQLSLIAGNQGVGASFIGASFSREDNGRKFALFSGAIGNAYSTPYSFANMGSHFGVGYSMEQATRHFKFASIGAIVGKQKTAIESIEYRRGTYLILSGAGGVLQNSPIVNGTAQFRARGFFGDINRQSLIYDTARADVMSEAAGYAFRRLQLQVSEVQGSSGRISTDGQVLGVTFRVNGWATLSSQRYTSRQLQPLLTNSATERVKRFFITEGLQTSKGTSFTSGIAYASNRFSASLGQSILYYPFFVSRSPWQQTFSASFTINIHNASATVSTLALPNGAVKFGVYGNSYVYREGDPAAQHATIGKFVVSGIVRDTDGRPVEGAAIKIDGQEVYTDSDGNFSARFSKSAPRAITVLTGEFMAGNWRVESSPQSGESGQSIAIVVKRVP